MESLEAIQNINTNICVLANAGSGKTKNLVDRYIALILAGAKPERILCVTYTEEATKEMSARIISKISNLYDNSFKNELHKEHNDALKAAALNINKISVKTFHAFCFEEIRANSNALALNNEISVMSELDSVECMQHLHKKISNEILDENAEIFSSVSELLSEYGRAAFIKLLEFMTGENMSQMSTIAANHDEYFKILSSLGISNSMNYKETIESIVENRELLDAVTQLSSALNSQFMPQWLAASSNEKIAQLDKLLLEIFTTEYKVRDKISKKNELFPVLYSFCHTIGKFYDRYCLHITKCILQIQVYIKQVFEDIKNKSSFIDYSDIINIIHSAISRSDVSQSILYSIYAKYDHIMIDEAQDMSRNQWDIINAILGEFIKNYSAYKKTFFIVGDIKQSIYGFRGASVSGFSEAIDKCSSLCKAYNIPFQQIDLLKSYRSAPNIMHFVDSVCNHREIKEKFGRIQDILHIPTKTQDGEIFFQTFDIAKTGVGKFEEVTTYVTDQIEHLRNLGVKDSDIIILFQSRSGLYHEILAKLQNKNIPVNADKITNKSLNLVCGDIINLLGLACNFINTYELCGLLKSPLFGLSETDIYKIRSTSKDDDIETIISMATDLKPEISDKLNALYLELENSSSAIDFLAKILSNETLKIKSFYPQKQLDSVIEAILSLIQSYEVPEAYLILSQNIDRIKLSNKSDGVSLMSIHKAKGLEAEVVFFIDMNLNFTSGRDSYLERFNYYSLNAPDNNLFFAKSKRLSHWLKILKNQNLNNLHSDLENINKTFDASENGRKLYVALTRAKSKLYIISSNEPSVIKSAISNGISECKSYSKLY